MNNEFLLIKKKKKKKGMRRGGKKTIGSYEQREERDRGLEKVRK